MRQLQTVLLENNGESIIISLKVQPLPCQQLLQNIKFDCLEDSKLDYPRHLLLRYDNL